MDVSASANSIALQGINQGFERLAENTQKIIKPGSEELETALIDNRQASTQVQTSAKALKTYDDMIGSIIDIMA
ncbi:MAG: hypothetical protein U9R28_01900 [Pseudomonadota bacterium]|nr:hypothetical protein [Pseudomonadota bacterium]